MSNQNPNNKIVTVNTSKNISLSREVPMNLGAEQALLGAIISNNLAFEKIENYCYEDVVATYLVWLHLQFTRGYLKTSEFENLKKRALNKLGEIQRLEF